MQILDFTPAVAPAPEKWVNLETVAEHVGFGVAKVTRMAKSGQIPAHIDHSGKRVFYRFKLSAVDAALKSM